MSLCSNHFEQNCLQKKNKYIILKNGAVPTIFNEVFKNSCIFCHEVNGRSDKMFHRYDNYWSNTLLFEF